MKEQITMPMIRCGTKCGKAEKGFTRWQLREAVFLIFAVPFLLPLFDLFMAWGDMGALWKSPAGGVRLFKIMGNSALLSLCCGLVAVCLGCPAGILAAVSGERIRLAIGASSLMLFVIPSNVLVVGLLTLAYYIPALDVFLYSFIGAALIQGWALSPLVFFPVYMATRSFPREWNDMGLLDSGRSGLMLRLWFPLAAVPALMGGGLAILLSYGDFVIPDILFSRNPRFGMVFSTEIQAAFAGFFDLERARRLGALFIPFPIAIAAGLLFLLPRFHETRGLDAHTVAEAAAPKPHRERFDFVKFAVSIFPFMSSLLLMISLAALAWMLLRDASAWKAVWRSASDELFGSLIVCGLCAAFILFAGILMSSLLLMRRNGRRGALSPGLAVFGFSALLSYFLPGSIAGVFLLRIFSVPFFADLRSTVIPLIALYFLRGAGLALPIILISAAAVPEERIALAQTDGCRFWGRIRHVLAPSCWRFWLAAFMLVFPVLMGETAGAMIVSPPGYTPLSVRIQTVMHYRPGAYVSVLCLMSAASALSVVAAAGYVFRKGLFITE
ncbi:MAG TPA: ABC transporter permease subunit [Candidatus Sumerlaeota bacterium]|nr:ABC transporter permease subunit [Candidatus Sumerlaeota bacterium]